MEEISFEWGQIPKALPVDKEELKQQLKRYLFNPQDKFVVNLRIAKRSARREGQEDLLIQHIDALFDEVLEESAYDFLKESEGFVRLLEKIPKLKQKSKEDIKKITLKELISDSQITNDLIGFSFMRFGRDLDKVPPFPFLEKFDLGTEVEFVFRESWSEKEQTPSGNYSFKSRDLKGSESTPPQAIIEVPPDSSEKISEEKAKFIKEKGVKSARYIQKGHSKIKVIKESFPFPINIKGLEEYRKKAFDSIIIHSFKGEEHKEGPQGLLNFFEPEEAEIVATIIASIATDKRKTKKIFEYDGEKYQIMSFGIYGQGKSNLGVFNATSQFEKIFDNWVEKNKEMIIKPVENILNDLETVKTVIIECGVKTVTVSKGKFFNRWKDADKAKRKAEKKGKIITDDAGNPKFVEVGGKQIPMTEAVEQPDIYFEVFEKRPLNKEEKKKLRRLRMQHRKDEIDTEVLNLKVKEIKGSAGEYRHLSKEEAKKLDASKNYQVKIVEEDVEGIQRLSEIKEAKDYEATLDKGASYPLTFMNEALAQATLQCTYYVKGHGHFDFSPYQKGMGAKGMNNPIREHIDELKVKVRALTRLGITV